MNHRDRELVRGWIAEAKAELTRDLEVLVYAEVAELRDELNTNVTDIDRRITAVHDRALRELTRRVGGSMPA